MNKLPIKTRALILKMLCEGQSMRATARLADVSFNTVAKILAEAGKVCADLHDERVRGVSARLVQCDEIWSFTYAKQKNVAKAKAAPAEAGDTWTWTALDSESKLIISYLVGGRDSEYAMAFMDDLRQRLATRVQLTTDGHKAYLEAVEEAFGADIDYAMLVKLYGEPAGQKGSERKYSPAECTGSKKVWVSGEPDKALVSTSHVERQNLTMRMHMRRFTRLTNAFSKKFESHAHMVALYTVFYNFCRIHKTLRVTPAMEAGLTDHVWDMEEVIAIMDARAPKPGRPKAYKKRTSENSN
jgi:IS1 family transposase